MVLDDDEVAALEDLTGLDEEEETSPTPENDKEEDPGNVFEEDAIDLTSGKKIPFKDHSEESDGENENEDVFGSNGVSDSYSHYMGTTQADLYNF